MMQPIFDLIAGGIVGLVSGLTAGLLGVSPGGGLVVLSVLLLGVEQHVAQGISLIAQVPPTSLGGIRRYRDKGNRSPLRWIVLLGVGFVAGGLAGAYAAVGVSDKALQWTYVAYLAALDVMLVLRGNRSKSGSGDDTENKQVGTAALLIIGLAGGLASGFLGIGGGLAITVGLSAVLGVPQHQAQMVSLVMSLIPTTLPSAVVYWSQGFSASWLAIVGVIAGLWLGTDFGARLANRLDKTTLQRIVVIFVAAMALFMARKAIG